MPSEMRIASLVSLGVGLFMNGELEDARRRFQAGIDEHNLKSQSEYLDDRYYMGQAHFYMGELARTDFRKVDLAAATTSEAMAKLLDDKCNHLLDAQMSYVRAIKTPLWMGERCCASSGDDVRRALRPHARPPASERSD